MKTREAVELFLSNREWRGLSIRTRQQYRQILYLLTRMFPNLPLTPEDIERFLASRNVSLQTIVDYIKVLKVFCNFNEKRHGIPNPMKYIESPKLTNKVMPTLEIGDIQLLSVFVKNQRDKALIHLLLDTGIRAGEAINLKRDDINEDFIKVKGKVGERIVPVSNSVVELLLSLPKYPDGYVFHGKQGRMTRSGVYYIVRKYLRMIGITGDKLGPHRLRHTFGRQYLVLGGDLRSLQLQLGHQNIQTTQKYANLAINDVIKKHHKYTPLQVMELSHA